MTEQHEIRNMLSEICHTITQRKAANQLGVHHNTIYGWLHGKEIKGTARIAIRKVHCDLLPLIEANHKMCDFEQKRAQST